MVQLAQKVSRDHQDNLALQVPKDPKVNEEHLGQMDSLVH